MFNLYCRSEFGEQGCYKTNIYSPQYDDSNDNKPKLNINCEGHGCYYLNLYAINGYSDVDISIDGCEQCESVNDCVQYWFMHCGANNYQMFDMFDGSECHSSRCDCSSMSVSVENTFQNQDYEHCGFIVHDITCNADMDCIVNCADYGDGCHGMINYIQIQTE